MKLTRITLTILFLSILSTTLSGCKKNKLKKLTGTWEYVNLGEIKPEEKTSTYTFLDDGYTLVRYGMMYDRIGAELGYDYDTTYYVVSKDKFIGNKYNLEVTVDYKNAAFMLHGRWDIITLNKTTLIIVNVDEEGGNHTYREFLRVD